MPNLRMKGAVLRQVGVAKVAGISFTDVPNDNIHDDDDNINWTKRTEKEVGDVEPLVGHAVVNAISQTSGVG